MNQDEKKEDEDLDSPTLSIDKVSNTGLLTIKFSHDFFPLSDESLEELKVLKEYDGELRSDIELFIEPFEYQSESKLKFTWEPTSFTEKKMEI